MQPIQSSKETIFAYFNSQMAHYVFKKNLGNIFAEKVAPGQSPTQYSLDHSLFSIDAVPIRLRSSLEEIVKWLLNNQYYPDIHNCRVLFRSGHPTKETPPKKPILLVDSLKVCNQFRESSLHIAARSGKLQKIEQLVRQGMNINAIDCAKKTALYTATINGHFQVVKWLLENNADPTLVNATGNTLLHVAAFYGQFEILELLLSYTSVKLLIHQGNRKGHEPLHHAILGKENPVIVQLLLDNGANLNANTCGFTPLHLAARHGKIEAAYMLILAGADLAILSQDDDLAFDLAFNYGQDDFLHFFLGTEKKLRPSKAASHDLEGYYLKCLLESKKENLTEEQIFYLAKISNLYTGKNNFVKGAELLNCAFALWFKLVKTCSSSGNKPSKTIIFTYLLDRLELIEKLFLKTKHLQDTRVRKKRIGNDRHMLLQLRLASCSFDHDRGNIKEVLQALSDGYKEILSEYIEEAMGILGQPPVRWACMGMGSMSRGEMCPYSDLEFAFILEKDHPKAKEYFRTLSEFLTLNIINLGETSFPLFPGPNPSPTPNGFSLDRGGNTPLGKPGIYELIGMAQELAGFQETNWIRDDIIVPNAMNTVCLIAGDLNILSEYEKEKNCIQEQIAEKKKIKNFKFLAMELLAGHLHDFRPFLGIEKEKEAAFGIKKELYRPFQEIINCLAILYRLKSRNTEDRIDELAEMNIISDLGSQNLKKALKKVLSLRLHAHLFYKEEKEFLCHPMEDKPKEPELLYLDTKKIETLISIYQVIIPFHQAVSEFHRTEDPSFLSNNPFYDDSPSLKGSVFEKTLQYHEALKAYQNAVSLNPNDSGTQYRLGVLQLTLGNNQESLSRQLKALALAEQKYGTEHANISIIYNSISEIYFSQKEYEKALEFGQQALEIGLKTLGKLDFVLAISYNNIGIASHALGSYNKALEAHQTALQIRLNSPEKNLSAISLSYNNIGAVYSSLKENDQALEFLKKALKTDIEINGENHPDVAAGYQNIGAIYLTLGLLDQALKNTAKALKINIHIFGDNHPKTMSSVINLCRIYEHLANEHKDHNRYDQAIRYNKMALNISIERLREKKLDIAKFYENIGELYRDLKQHEKASKYLKYALSVRFKIAGKSHPDNLKNYTTLGVVLYELEQFEEALNYFCNFFEILSSTDITSYNVFLDTLIDYAIGCSEGIFPHPLQILKLIYADSVKILGQEHQTCQKLNLYIKTRIASQPHFKPTSSRPLHQGREKKEGSAISQIHTTTSLQQRDLPTKRSDESEVLIARNTTFINISSDDESNAGCCGESCVVQ